MMLALAAAVALTGCVAMFDRDGKLLCGEIERGEHLILRDRPTS